MHRCCEKHKFPLPREMSLFRNRNFAKKSLSDIRPSMLGGYFSCPRRVPIEYTDGARGILTLKGGYHLMIRWSGCQYSLDFDTFRKHGYPHFHKNPVLTSAPIFHMRVFLRFPDILGFMILLFFVVSPFSDFHDF